MPEQSEHSKEQSVLFTSLVMSLSTSAMQQLGKLVNPLTGKTQVDLDGAQMTIDLLAMLQEKTKGNLADDETRLLANVLSSLQMNYVETAQSEQAKAARKDKKEEKAGEGIAAADEGKGGAPAAKSDEGQPSAGADTAGSADKKDPKFHKSYGEK